MFVAAPFANNMRPPWALIHNLFVKWLSTNTSCHQTEFLSVSQPSHLRGWVKRWCSMSHESGWKSFPVNSVPSSDLIHFIFPSAVNSLVVLAVLLFVFNKHTKSAPKWSSVNVYLNPSFPSGSSAKSVCTSSNAAFALSSHLCSQVALWANFPFVQPSQFRLVVSVLPLIHLLLHFPPSTNFYSYNVQEFWAMFECP